MDPSGLINAPRDGRHVLNGNKKSLYGVLYYMKWTSCLIGLVTGCVLTIYLTISLMLIITPYLQTKGPESSDDNDIWGNYGDWKWESCSVTCGHGVQQGQRSRSCLSKSACVGSETEIMTRYCTSSPCKVDGQWSDWKSHLTCSVTCGKGTQTLYRECSNPHPQNGGRTCDGERLKQVECNQQTCCPKNTEDSSWKCDGGWMRRDDFGACYCFSSGVATWYNAQRNCRIKGSELANIYSSAESTWISENCKRHIGRNAWIGGKKVGYSYKWILQTGNNRMNFTNWAPNEPVLYSDNGFTCVQIWASAQYKWDDYKCSVEQKFICKGRL